MTLILNCEADEILYRAAFAVEKQCYKLTLNNGKVRNFGTQYTKSEILARLTALGFKDYNLEGYKKIEPLENALYLVKRIIRKLEQLGEVRLWLSPADKSNFRFAVAKTPGPYGLGYKAGRPPKPIYHGEIREYLIKHHGAQEIENYEADDALGMYQTDNTVAVHIDKDINMIAGKHYHWVNSERYIVEEPGKLPGENRGSGKAFFFHQMLTGDRTDNIPGIPNIGPVKATKHLSECKTEKEMLDKVRSLYYPIYKENTETVLIEIANLLYIVDNKNRTGADYIQSLTEGMEIS